MKNRFIFRDDTTETCGGPEETYDTTPHTVIRRLSMKSDITGHATSTAQHEGRFVMSTPHIFLSKASEKTGEGMAHVTGKQRMYRFVRLSISSWRENTHWGLSATPLLFSKYRVDLLTREINSNQITVQLIRIYPSCNLQFMTKATKCTGIFWIKLR